MTSFSTSTKHAFYQLRNVYFSKARVFLQGKLELKMWYLFFADVLIGLIFKPLLDTSKRHVPVIFGNIFAETEGKQRQEK